MFYISIINQILLLFAHTNLFYSFCTHYEKNFDSSNNQKIFQDKNCRLKERGKRKEEILVNNRWKLKHTCLYKSIARFTVNAKLNKYCYLLHVAFVCFVSSMKFKKFTYLLAQANNKQTGENIQLLHSNQLLKKWDLLSKNIDYVWFN